jgi:CBS domain-containing protein
VVVTRAPRQCFDSPASSVRDVMTRNVRFCRPEDTLAAAAIAMFEADCRFLPVVDETGRPIGVVTDGDICLLGSTSHRRLRDMCVRDAMSGPPATCRTGDEVLGALKVMRARRIRHLPVIGDQGLLEGVLSLTDVVLCAEEGGSASLRQELAAALREIVQKHGDHRVIVHNPFVED